MASTTGYPSDLTTAEWNLLRPLFCPPNKRGPKHGSDLREVVNAVLYVAHTGCQWRYLPERFGPWTRVWTQFRRWSENGTWARVLYGLHQHARTKLGRDMEWASLVVIDTHLARGSSNGGVTFHDKGGYGGRTKGAKRAVAVDVTGLPVAALVVPVSTHDNITTEMLLDQMRASGAANMLEVVLVDRGVTQRTATDLSEKHCIEVRRVGWEEKSSEFRPIAHAWRVEVAHGRLGRSRRLSKSFENTRQSGTGWLQVACIAMILDELRPARTASRQLSA